MTEKEKMVSGLLYNPRDKDISTERLKTHLLVAKLNTIPENEKKARSTVLKEIFQNSNSALWIQSPFFCDYGSNIICGENVFFNFNCVVLDAANVTIGNRTLIGPNVQIYTSTHPFDYEERALGLESAKAITIGEDVWIGGSVVVCPGVTIGNRSIIGAGSVVTKNIPSDVMAAGNPCVVIRELKDKKI